MKHTVVAISRDPKTLEPIEPVLQRESFSVHRVDNVEGTFGLCRELEHLDLLNAGYPPHTHDIGIDVVRIPAATPLTVSCRKWASSLAESPPFPASRLRSCSST